MSAYAAKRKEKTPSPSRRALLDDAAMAMAKGRHRRALRKYSALLDQEPNDPAVHAKVAELFGKLKQPAKAREHVMLAAQLYGQKGFEEKALAVYRNGVQLLPRDLELWQIVAHWYRDHGHRRDAIKTLLKGRRRFRARRFRAEAITLLEEAVALEPWHFEATFDLARVLAAAGRGDDARKLFDGLAERMRGRHLRRVRGAQLSLWPSPAALWRWLRAVLTGR